MAFVYIQEGSDDAGRLDINSRTDNPYISPSDLGKFGLDECLKKSWKARDWDYGFRREAGQNV